MPGRESLATLGAQRSRQLRNRLADELHRARLAGGLSLREVARTAGISADRLRRTERGEAGAMTVDLVARIAPILGLQLAASLYPNGDPVRDRAHLALLERLRRRLHPSVGWTTEVPMPIAGDLRAGDAVIGVERSRTLVEAETRLSDLQTVDRRAQLKARDLGVDHVILLLADTPHHRHVVALHPELRARYGVTQRRCLAALARGTDPGGSCLVIL